MSEKLTAKGRCLCGAVEVIAHQMDRHAGCCHCSFCRKWVGGPFMTVDCGSEVEFGGADKITVYESSDWAERGFCSQCGSHLFYRLKGNRQHHMPVGIFDKEAELDLDHQVFIDEKPDYYAFANETQNLTGEQVFALFAAQGESQYS